MHHVNDVKTLHARTGDVRALYGYYLQRRSSYAGASWEGSSIVRFVAVCQWRCVMDLAMAYFGCCRAGFEGRCAPMTW